MSSSLARSVLPLCIGLIAGFGVCILLVQIGMISGIDRNDTVSRLGGYQFINPLLSCDIDENIPYGDLSPIRTAVSKEIDVLVREGKAQRIGYYFRDIDYGHWTGVHESDRFIPASMMKLPILISYLRESQTNASLLSSTMALPQGADANEGEYFKPPHPLTQGRSYTIQQLLDAMIMESDNNASNVLSAHASTTVLADVYGAFGVEPVMDPNTDTVSPMEYSRFFRILYNASYIGRTRSTAALEMMAKSTFTQGIVAGLPSGSTVSHKFGERTITTLDKASGRAIAETKYLSDCGIVYYPRTPYMICVMTQGKNFDDLAEAIARVSKVTYDQIDRGVLQR